MADTSDRPLSPGQAAAILGVSVETVRVWADNGTLPSFRTIGNHRRFRRADVEALIPQDPAA